MDAGVLDGVNQLGVGAIDAGAFLGGGAFDLKCRPYVGEFHLVDIGDRVHDFADGHVLAQLCEGLVDPGGIVAKCFRLVLGNRIEFRLTRRNQAGLADLIADQADGHAGHEGRAQHKCCDFGLYG